LSRQRLQKTGENRYTLDVRGQVCPYPELLTLKALQRLAPDDTLEVIVDNPPSIRDIPITLEKRGYAPPHVTRLNGTWRIVVQPST
jgi:TusA-related sulfurtransferase